MALTSIQRQWNIQAAYLLQAGLGVFPAAGTAGANILPMNTGRGNMTMDAIPSLQIRQDGMTIRGRHGTQKTKGAYKGELQAGNFDPIMEAVMRGVWTPGGGLGGSILQNPGPGLLQRRYFTIEEFEVDLTQSEVYHDCVFTMFELTMRPNGMIDFAHDWIGTGQVQGIAAATGGAVPIFATPTLPTPSAQPMAALDAVVNLSDIGVLLDLTAFTLKVDLRAVAPPVAASRFSPDVFDGVMEVSGSVTIMRRDLQPFIDALAETSIILQVTASTPDGTGQFRFTVPFMTYQSAEKSEFRRDGGPLNVTIPFPAALVGVDTTPGNVATMVTIERNATS